MHRCELTQRLIKGDQVIRARLRGRDSVMSVTRGLSADARSLMGARMVDQDSSHHLCRDAEEVCPVLPWHPFLADQPQIHFVHQGSGLQRVVSPFIAKVGGGASSKL